jgi:hypothetical protein
MVVVTRCVLPLLQARAQLCRELMLRLLAYC